MIHDPALHRLLAPQDLPHHVVYHHNVAVEDVLNMWSSTPRVARYLRTHGIESTGDVELDALTAYHEKAHAYSESRTAATRRAEQRRRALDEDMRIIRRYGG